MAQVVGLVLLAVLAVALAVLLIRVMQRRREDGFPAGPSVRRGGAGGGPRAVDLGTPSMPGGSPSGTPLPTPVPDGPAMDEDRSPLDPASARLDPPRERTLPELVQGLQWPCELVPHVAPDQPDSDSYLALVTTQARPPQVAAALTAELERLGYAVMALSEDELVARRDDDLLSARIHPRAGIASAGGVPLFPRAAPEAVAVELWPGGGPSPRRS